MNKKKIALHFNINRHVVPVFLCLLMHGIALAKPLADAVFPLKLSTGGKYLVDKNDKPFLIKEISAWGAIQALSEQDEAAFIDSIKQTGFNTMLVSIISFDTRFAGNPPNWKGIAPFKTQWDFSTYNAAYFEHVDRFLQMAEKKGMLVLLVPCYLGYKDDAKQGWWNELLDAHNDADKSRQYGEFIGSRYKSFNNIIWVAGGDNNGVEPVYSHLNNIIDGIKTFDKKHLWTGHFDSSPGNNWPSSSSLYGRYIDIDGLYDFTESSLGEDVTQYSTELEKYGAGKMIFQLDQSYEHDIPHGPDNENYQWIRRKNYDGLLSGCAGTSFSPGQKDNQCYVFINWRPLVSTTGMRQVNYCFNLFASRAWHKLVPVGKNETIISNRGQFGSIDYVCAAKTSDSSTLIAYLPVGGTVTVDLKAIAGKEVMAWWYDVRGGIPVFINTFANKAVKEFTAPTKEDWLLVIDNAALKLPPPGAITKR